MRCGRRTSSGSTSRGASIPTARSASASGSRATSVRVNRSRSTSTTPRSSPRASPASPTTPRRPVRHRSTTCATAGRTPCRAIRTPRTSGWSTRLPSRDVSATTRVSSASRARSGRSTAPLRVSPRPNSPSSATAHPRSRSTARSRRGSRPRRRSSSCSRRHFATGAGPNTRHRPGSRRMFIGKTSISPATSASCSRRSASRR